MYDSSSCIYIYILCARWPLSANKSVLFGAWPKNHLFSICSFLNTSSLFFINNNVPTLLTLNTMIPYYKLYIYTNWTQQFMPTLNRLQKSAFRFEWRLRKKIKLINHCNLNKIVCCVWINYIKFVYSYTKCLPPLQSMFEGLFI